MTQPVLPAGTDAASLLAADKQHLWHPFTHMQPWIDGDPAEPLVIARGEGMKLQDVNGRWYYDGTSSIWLNVHGHNVPALNRAIEEQLGQIAHSTLLGLSNVPAVRLAEKLAQMTGGELPRVFLSENGAAAVEVALKVAVQYHANRARHGESVDASGGKRRTKILNFRNNYHGDTQGAMAVAPDDLFHWPFLGLLANHPRAEYPNPYRSRHGSDPAAVTAGCLAEVREVVARHGDELAAMIIEPVQGAGGIIPAPREYFTGLREICDETGILLIFDEVATGFGRTGPLFAWQGLGVTPDIVCLGKGLSGGYLPVSATLFRPHVFEAFLGPVDSGRTFFHGHSYGGNQLGCAVSLASCELLEREVLPLLPAKIERMAQHVAPWREYPHVGDVRQAGMMVGVELVADRASKRGFDYCQQAGSLVVRAAIERGLIIRNIGNIVIVMPPLAISMAELDEVFAIATAAFEDTMSRLVRLAADLAPNDA